MDPIHTLVSDKDPGQTVQPDATFDTVNGTDYELLLLPGGTLNADSLRLDNHAIGMVKAFAASGRPIAAICHGPWALVEADVLKDKTLTSYASLRTDIRNAGAKSWVDEPVVSDTEGGYTLVTSRTPKGLDDFIGAIHRALAGE
ncbi:protease [Streptomyces sp. A7024]|uniref:Protease n=1 Tax=Streptomyces coryli TaxID=1128680 RepID=A0A6G4TUW9_9ACTN|nr:protease [Streptomyces coryli]